MTRIPTKQMIRLFERAIRNQGKFIRDGTYGLIIDGANMVLEHYSTVICRINHTEKTIQVGTFGVSDRDAINGLLVIQTIEPVAFIKNNMACVKSTVKDSWNREYTCFQN